MFAVTANKQVAVRSVANLIKTLPYKEEVSAVGQSESLEFPASRKC